MQRNPIACLQSWSDELTSRASRVRNLIGDAHWLSDGHHKEELVRQFLIQHLPRSLRVTRGFICPSEQNSRVSPEIDILISDQESELPWFMEGGLAIVPPSAACAQLHVKTTFAQRELRDVFQSSFRVFESCETRRDPATVWSGAIFFEKAKATTAEKCAKLFFRALALHLEAHSNRSMEGCLPDCMAIVEGPLIISDKRESSTGGRPYLQIRIFDCGKLSVALLLSHFYDSLTQRGRNLNRRGEWAQLLQQEQYRLVADKSIVFEERQ